MDLQLTKDGLRCALTRAGQLCVRHSLTINIVVAGLSVHNLDIKDMVYNLQYYINLIL